MNGTDRDNWLIALFGGGVSLLVVLLGIPAAVIAAVIFLSMQRSQPPEFEVAPNYDARSWEAETTNPAPMSRRITEVRFIYKDRLPPESLIGAIELKTIWFEQSDYEPTTKTFRKILNDTEMPGNGNLNLRFYIRNPKWKDYRFIGRLEIYFGDRKSPDHVAYDNFPILCTD